MLLRSLLRLCFAVALGAHAAEPLSYNRDIRPFLSDKCFHCHGPDSAQRKADLRLDVPEGALLDDAIVPGHPEKSQVMEWVVATDPDDHMPPAKSKLESLTPGEVEKLRRWIVEGAKYEALWSLIPPRAPAVAAHDREPIDALISSRLAARGLAFQPEADPATLLRRVTFDLTGLPPTVEETEASLRDPSLAAYEQTVDRLLASPRFGERMAVDWLDVARYADSYGFQVDRDRDVWPWRDWVVRAFNANLPYDQFITWQIAGDLLPGATDEQILATAFNRLHQQESEGGSVEEEYRIEYVCDRVQTFATAFLGLTFECARCHDHKFDPIKQKEYYGLSAFFQNIDEAGLYSFFTPSVPTPALALRDDAAKKKLAELRARASAEEEALAAAKAGAAEAFDGWLKSRPAELSIPGELARYAFDPVDRGKLRNRIDPAKPAVLKGENKLVPGRKALAVEFTGDDPVELPLGNFATHQPFTISLWLKTPDVKDRAVVLHRSRAWTDAGSRGYELLLEEGRLKWSLIHFWPGNAASVRTTAVVPINQWVHAVVSSDGSGTAAGLRIAVDGQLAALEVVRDALTREITGGGGDNLVLGERFRDRGFRGGAVEDVRVFDRELSPLETRSLHDQDAAAGVLQKFPDTLTAAELGELREYFLAAFFAPAADARKRLQEARTATLQAAIGAPEIMVMRESPKPKPAYVLFRGQYDQRRDEAPPCVPAVLPPFPEDAPRNRLGLARWLTAPGHPLTARVAVNRFWQALFGRGLVKTAEDFGNQGARPLYPEVLDLLATHFVASGWDTKALFRKMVLSQTYRQRSLASPQTMADDPDNEWLARGPRLRLPAEMIRDNALAASGLLVGTVGGAPVSPYEMSEAFKPATPAAGPGLYRRSLYAVWRRTSPPPALLAFDAPRRAVCAARRERTDSPLQALILLNGVQYVEAARVLGERLLHDASGDLPGMIEKGFLRCLSRRPDARETQILTQLYTEQTAWFAAHAKEAEDLLKIGHAPRDTSLPAAQAAAATVLAQALLNHDACVVKR